MINPLSAALDMQRKQFEEATEGMDVAKSLPETIDAIQDIDVGQTPSEVVYEENKLELLHYQVDEMDDIDVDPEDQEDVPILIIYALINKPFILDLQPNRSVVRRLLEAGHDVYLIDWNDPSRLDKHLTLEDYINRYIDNCVDVVRDRSDQESINILGYCMGGTMSTIYTALNREKVNALGLMATGLYFEESGGVLERWGDEEYFDPREITETFGNVPADFLDVGFAVMDPVDNYVSKYLRFFENLDNESFVRNFARMERWLSEGPDVAGDTYVQFLEEIYQENNLYNNEMYLGDEHVDIKNIDVPFLQIVAEYDHLVPPSASKPFNDVIGSDDVTTIEYSTGHVGMAVSRSTHADVWPEVCEWFKEKSQPAEEAEEPAVEEKAAEEEGEDEATEQAAIADDTDVEAIDGIGPTYADRLREAGIDTIGHLKGEDAATIAEITQASVSQAEDWLEQAS